MKQSEIYEGMKVKRITILRRGQDHIHPSGNTVWRWIVKCDCGKEYSVLQSSLHIIYECRECAYQSRRSKNTVNNKLWDSTKRGAIQRSLELNISRDFAWKLYIKQDKQCAITKLPIHLRESGQDKQENTASLDRINSNKGYIKNNVQRYHKKINRIILLNFVV